MRAPDEYVRGIISEGPALPPRGEESDAITEAIEQVVDHFPARTRAIAELRLRYHRTTPEIAETLGITTRTVERHIPRIAADLRAELPARLR